jgi:hypothetical protein
MPLKKIPEEHERAHHILGAMETSSLHQLKSIPFMVVSTRNPESRMVNQTSGPTGLAKLGMDIKRGVKQ